MEQWVILCDEEVQLQDLPEEIRETTDLPEGVLPFKEAKQQTVRNFEKRYIERALLRNDGNITHTAEELGLYRQNLQQKMKEYGIRAGHEK